ncbi:uncharacterized protein LOC111124750 [Crassostrea virginica]|uniref:Uncharacterized protein LOC111124750 n=1 Tax=Crassostrea virginica TaxID=6565 RepID=A0A8B8D7M2_CRAVI|nr:uncharacterized protein LOC111124750 [Crassostrea virginica]
MASVLKSVKGLFSIPDDTLMQLSLPAALLMFAVIVPWGRKSLMNTTSIIFAAKGFGLLLYPEAVKFWFLRGSPDGLHLQEMRHIGIILMAMAFTHYLTRNSTDKGTEINLLWSRTVLCGAVFLLSVVHLVNYTEKEERAPLFVWKISALVTGLYFAAFLFYSLREDDWGGSADYLSSRTNLHLRIDFFIFFLHGLMAYCFPATIATFQTKLVSLDSMHDYAARVMGAGFLALGITSGRANNCHTEDDKKSVLLSHGLANGVFFLTMLLCQVFSNVFSQWHIYGICVVLLVTLNDLMGSEAFGILKDFLKRFKSNKEE